MCGRFSQHYTSTEVHAFLSVCSARRSAETASFLPRASRMDRREGGTRRPTCYRPPMDRPCWPLQSLWERWRNPEGDEVLSATVIVSGASEWMIPYHDRMPVLLSGADIDGTITRPSSSR